MKDKYRKYVKWWLDEFCAGDQLDHYVKLFPELDSRLAKFAVGIFIWNMQGFIDLNNPDDVSRVRLILKVLDQTPGFDFFDNEFNGANPATVCSIIGMAPVSPVEEGKIEYNYEVFYISNFESARQYSYATSWCIVISEESFNDYTANGNRFYFCENGRKWDDTPCIPGMGFPHDRFGYSLIAVEVTPDNKIASVTSRWNTCAGNTDDFLTQKALREVLGEENYSKLFVEKK